MTSTPRVARVAAVGRPMYPRPTTEIVLKGRGEALMVEIQVLSARKRQVACV
jgi:hypothetical protein